MSKDNQYGRFGSGHSVRRIEDPTLITGQGRFVDDVNVEGQTHLSFVRSPHAHARIVSIDTEAARAMPGVIAVYTGADLAAAGVHPLPSSVNFKRPGGAPPASPPRHALALDTVRYVGDAVACVVAETREQAREARDAVWVDYAELPAVVTLEDATAEGAPLVWDAAEGNLCAQMLHGKRDEADAAFASAAHVVGLDLVNQRLVPLSMEPRSVLASHDTVTGRTEVRMSTQMPGGVRNTLCDEVFKIPKDSIRVIAGDVGGGFGMKTGLYPEDAVVTWASRTLGRPVKWIAERGEEFLSSVHGRDLRSRAEIALDAQGKVLALRVVSHANVGAYAIPTGVAIQLLIGPWVSTSIYDIPVIDFTLTAVLTNTAPTSAYRGAGRPEAIYTIERLMDAASRQLGLEPTELRRRNMIRPEQMPYRNPMGMTYDTGQFEKVMNQALELADWSGYDARHAASASAGKLRGRGLATFLEWTGGNVFEERVTVTVAGDGFIEIYSATQAMGQGIATTYAQLAVDAFGVPIERIRIVQGDTDRGVGFGSAGSRSLFTGGSAVRVASERTIDAAKPMAADALEAGVQDIEYRAGHFEVAGTDRRIDLFELARRQPEARIFMDSTSSVEGPTWPNGAHVCEVEIDPSTGTVSIDSYASVNDVGRVVNPMIVRGQLDGGAVQGLGQALCEHMVYDRESGQPLTGSLLDYTAPRADMVRSFKTEMDQDTPCKNNPLGVKGVGELGTIGATPALVNAVVDALYRAGVGDRADRIQMPLTPETVWRCLRGLEARA